MKCRGQSSKAAVAEPPALLKLCSLQALCGEVSGRRWLSRLWSQMYLLHSGSCVFWLFLSPLLSLGDTGSVRDDDGSAQIVHSRVRGPEMCSAAPDRALWIGAGMGGQQDDARTWHRAAHPQ